MDTPKEALQLFQENSKLAPWILNQNFPSLMQDEDLLQEAYIGLWKACLKYQSGNAKFSTFASTCIRNQILMELRKRNSKIHSVTLSMDAPMKSGEDATFMELIEDEKLLIENQEIFFKDFINHLNERDRKVIQLRMVGLDQYEASSLLGISQSYYSRLLKTLREKYEAYSNENEEREET